MCGSFDADKIAKLGWRQGAVLGPELTKEAASRAPKTVSVADGDWIVVSSHDCDLVSASLDKEPVVEVLRATVDTSKKIDKQKSGGRSPRSLELGIDLDSGPVVLVLAVHDRWTIPRGLLQQETPKTCLPATQSRLIAEWLAKRYIRAAFPTAFDLRWRKKRKQWEKLLKKHSEWIQGVYLRLSTLDELSDEEPYKCHLILAVPHDRSGGDDWPTKRQELETAIVAFWEQFAPGIECVGVEPLGTDEITLADIEPYQRFDADWVSFEDESATTPTAADLQA